MKNTLRAARALAGLTQADLAIRAGVSRQTIHAIESGKYVPSTLLALKFASILNRDVASLFELENDDWNA